VALAPGGPRRSRDGAGLRSAYFPWYKPAESCMVLTIILGGLVLPAGRRAAENDTIGIETYNLS